MTVYELKELLRIYGKLLPTSILIIGIPDINIVSILLKETPIGSKMVIIEPDKSKILDWSIESNSYNITTKVFDSDFLEYKNLEYIKSVVNGSDFVLITCANDYDLLSEVFDKYSPLVREGGVIAINDIISTNFWNIIKRELPHENIISDTGKGIGILYV